MLRQCPKGVGGRVTGPGFQSHGKCSQPKSPNLVPLSYKLFIICLLKKLLEKADLRDPFLEYVYLYFSRWALVCPTGFNSAWRQGGWVVARPRSLLLNDLDDVLVLHGVGQAHPLRAVLGAGALGGE